MFCQKTPGQNASQASSLAVETNTDRKYTLACAALNKLCWTGEWQRKGSELSWRSCGIYCKPVSSCSVLGTWDGEGYRHRAWPARCSSPVYVTMNATKVDDAMLALHPLWKAERLADPVHLGQSHFRASNQAEYSDETFHSIKKKKKRSYRECLAIT